MNSATPNGGEPMVPARRTLEVSGDPNAEEIASAVDPVHSTHSSGREKVLEHIFLGDLLRALWRMGVHDVQVLRPEIDRNGYEFMLGHERSGARSNSRAPIGVARPRKSRSTAIWRMSRAAASSG
jgi:hypothetical protein